MFYDAVEKGRKAGETTISHDEALSIILGGLIRFAREINEPQNKKDCEKILFCISKASNALQGEFKDAINTLMGLAVSMDSETHERNTILNSIANLLGISSKELEDAFDDFEKNHICKNGL